MNSSIKLLGV